MANLKNLKSDSVLRRENVERSFGKFVATETAARAIGKITPGMEVFGFSKGQFSKIDIIEHCLLTTGPADVTIVTWSASAGDIKRAHSFLNNRAIRGIRFLVDFSFKARKPHFLKALVEAFGPDCIRMTVIHAKFVLIRNEDWNIVLRTSMNLNYNPRFENFEISESKEFAKFMQAILDEIWDNSDLGESLCRDTGTVQRKFRQMYAGEGLEKQNVLDLVPGEL